MKDYFKNSKERSRKISESKKKLVAEGTLNLLGKGDKSPAWKGGVSKYRFERTKTLEDIAGRSKPKVCEVCGNSKKICFDHDHATGHFRGWICGHCNTILGFARDKTELLYKLIDYLNQPKSIQLSKEQLRLLNIKN